MKLLLIIFQKDLNVKELEERNTSSLQQLAEMVDSVAGMGPIVTRDLYEKGLRMPSQNVTISGGEPFPRTASRSRSRASFRSTGRESECSFNLDDQDNEGFLSRGKQSNSLCN